jgi:TonB-linked SusC/RagA family outer membrane protein
MQRITIKNPVIKRGLFKKIMRIMKISIFLITVACLQVSADGFAQSVTVSGENVPIEKIFSSIKNQTGYTFWYNLELVAKAKRLDVNIRNKPLKEALDICFSNQPFTYEIIGKTIVVKEKANTNPSTTVLTEKPLPPPNIDVHGKVVNEEGEPLVGVSITISGSTAGTSTGPDGTYSINAPENGVLIFSFVGYTSQTFSINSRQAIDVQLIREVSALNNVVIVGYGTQRKIDITGSIATVQGEEITKQASFNPLSALQGKVAGVQITNSGSPGAPPQMIIRGVGTVYGNTNPLFVVDGVWYDDISFLNNNDIESVSVLKDPSSESIYGIRAANGVVLITTKKGKRNGKPVFNYNGFVGNQVVTNQVKMASGPEYAELINEVYSLNGSPTLYPDPSSFGTTDWYHLILRNALVSNQQISTTGGGEKSTYNFSLGYYHQDGLVKNNDFDKYSVHVSNDYQVTSFLKVGVNTTGILSTSNDAPGSIFYDLFNAAPIVPAFY